MLSEMERRIVDAVPAQLFIGGRWQESSAHTRLAVEDPATARTLTAVADAGPTEARAALDAAVAAQDGFAAMPARERGEILRRCFSLIRERADDFACLITLEMGKPLREASAEVAYAAEFFRWFAEEAVRVSGRWASDPAGHGRLLTMRHPVGPCLLITPWNFPLAMGTRKIGPAVAAGCAMVVKPAAQTPLSMLALAALMAEAGLPPGVLNVVTTSTPGPTLSGLFADERLRKLSFTGSTEIGKTLMAQASTNLLRLSMELGGNAPFLVFDDCDLDLAVDQAVVAKMRNMGQSCVAANRFHVQRSVAEEFGRRLADRMHALRVGPGTDPTVDVGPLIDDTQRAKVRQLVAGALARGATVADGGTTTGDGPGYFFPPTVLTGLDTKAVMYRTEIFGPVAPIYPFDTEADALGAANGTPYGLVAYVFTGDLARALRVVESLQVGMVGLNKGMVSNAAAPFGGVKWSGLGREGGPEGIEEYLTTKYVGIEA
ncbi:NAD-dependent succinate-semialdehyde dehydrogenase [Phytohabitans suffuscus]